MWHKGSRSCLARTEYSRRRDAQSATVASAFAPGMCLLLRDPYMCPRRLDSLFCDRRGRMTTKNEGGDGGCAVTLRSDACPGCRRRHSSVASQAEPFSSKSKILWKRAGELALKVQKANHFKKRAGRWVQGKKPSRLQFIQQKF
eukprot:959900-Pleurochrysis_carterae.AAC.1